MHVTFFFINFEYLYKCIHVFKYRIVQFIEFGIRKFALTSVCNNTLV